VQLQCQVLYRVSVEMFRQGWERVEQNHKTGSSDVKGAGVGQVIANFP